MSQFEIIFIWIEALWSIYASVNWVITRLGDGLSPIQYQAITVPKTMQLDKLDTQEQTLGEILTKIQQILSRSTFESTVNKMSAI